MKKLATLLLAAGMVLGSFAGAQAIDFKAKGEWIFEFGYTSGIKLANNSRSAVGTPRAARYGNGNGVDNFTSVQRVRLQIDAVASESLSGQVFFEIGDQKWGTDGAQGAGAARNSGGSLGTDGVAVEVRRAFIDWIVPNTDLRVRMGLQGMALPSYTFESGVFFADVAGITASYKFNENVSLAAFWARPYNDNWGGGRPHGRDNEPANFMDNVDAFGLVLPLSFDGFKITPWGMLSFIGPNALNGVNTQLGNDVRDGLFPAYWATSNSRGRSGGYYGDREYATAWWVGLTGEITAADPFRFAWDANYGEVTHTDASYLNRHGWWINALAEYKLDWGVPGIIGWWGSGDDGNVKNGSERLPIFSVNNANLQMSHFGFNGGYYSNVSDGNSLGQMYAGSWGIGARIRDISFIEDLKSVVRVNIFGGTNDPKMAKYMLGKRDVGGRAYGSASGLGIRDFNGGFSAGGSGAGAYLTTQDYGMEINFDHIYKIYENLDLMVELGYIHLWLDQSRGVWGADPYNGVRGVSVTDAVKASVFFRYSF